MGIERWNERWLSGITVRVKVQGRKGWKGMRSDDLEECEAFHLLNIDVQCSLMRRRASLGIEAHEADQNETQQEIPRSSTDPPRMGILQMPTAHPSI